MIAGLDSSFSVPTLAQAQQAYAAGVRVWGGYFGSRDGLGLAVRWPKEAFDTIKQAGMTAIAFCSGWDDPAWVRDTAAAWGVLACVDVEAGIRDDGVWKQGWLDISGAGLYGLMRVHAGVRAKFHIMSLYPGYDPGATWADGLSVRPDGPCGWQWWGDHREFGLSVDRGNYDDWFAPSGGKMTRDDWAAFYGALIVILMRDPPLLDANQPDGEDYYWADRTLRDGPRATIRAFLDAAKPQVAGGNLPLRFPAPAPAPVAGSSDFALRHALKTAVGPLPDTPGA